MKVLIGTPIHESKDYSMERWLQSVSRVRTEYPADLLLVDNSPGLGYVEKVKGYCEKYGVGDCQIQHLELPSSQERFERIARSREVIRREFLSKDYDAWLSWESDILVPPDTLGELANLMRSGDFMVVDHQC